MLGDSLTFTLGGSGGSAKVLKKINQDKYSSEYLLRSATDEIRARVRHSASTKAGVATDYHNVELTQTVFAAGDVSQKVRKSFITIGAQVGDDPALAIDVAEALVFFCTGSNIALLAGWES